MFTSPDVLVPLAQSTFEFTGSAGRVYSQTSFLGWSAEDALIALIPALAVAIFFAIRHARRERFWRRMFAARSSKQWDE